MMADDFRPTATWDRLRLRATLLKQLRQFFDEQGFLEVETPLLSTDTCVDRHLDPIPVLLPDDPRHLEQGRRMWLQTSPEFGMKRLMASGGEAIYQMTRAFRMAEVGQFHNPEFTILEWYRRGDSMQDGMALLSELSDTLLGTGPATLLGYAEAFQRFVGVDPLRASDQELQQAANDSGIQLTESGSSHTDRDDWLNLLLTELIEPRLSQEGATILYDYPASQAALAKVRAGDPPVAERFELYVAGIELANGYHELVDADVLRQRNAEANVARTNDGKYTVPTDSRLLTAMQHGLPECTGVALGWDRLVMLAAGASVISDVLSFPDDRA